MQNTDSVAPWLSEICDIDFFRIPHRKQNRDAPKLLLIRNITPRVKIDFFNKFDYSSEIENNMWLLC